MWCYMAAIICLTLLKTEAEVAKNSVENNIGTYELH